MRVSQKGGVAFLKNRCRLFFQEDWCLGTWVGVIVIREMRENIYDGSVYDGGYVE